MFKDKFLNIVLQEYRDTINYMLDNLYIKSETDAFFSGRQIATTSPLQGGGTLEATRTLSIKELSGLGANNQLLGAQDDYRDGWEYKTLTSTANQVTVTHAVGTVTFSTPQDIATTSNVQFGECTLDNDGLHLLDTNASLLCVAQHLHRTLLGLLIFRLLLLLHIV